MAASRVAVEGRHKYLKKGSLLMNTMHIVHHGHGFFFGSLENLLWLVLFGILVFALIRLLTRRGRHWRTGMPPFGPGFQPPHQAWHQAPPPPHQPHQAPHQYQPQQLSAIEILRQRYARGEIDAVTFDQMRERIEAAERPAE